jgi:hypothetical protein
VASDTNPDLVALGKLAEFFQNLSITWPDGFTDGFRDIDIGYMSTPVDNPYVSLHSADSRAVLRHLGMGAGMRARAIEIDVFVNIEYEDADPVRGFERITQLKWDVLRALVEHKDLGDDVEIADVQSAHMQVVTPDDGDFQDWGFLGQLVIPMTIHLKGGIT